MKIVLPQRLISAFEFYKVYILISNDSFQYAVTQRVLLKEKLIHSGSVDRIPEDISSLLDIQGCEINQNNLEIIIGLAYPLSTIREISISSHLSGHEISSTLLRQARKEILGKNLSIELDIAYRQMSKDLDKQTFQVSVVKTDYIHSLKDFFGDFAGNISSIIPLPEKVENFPNDKIWTNGLPESLHGNRILVYLSKSKGHLNHIKKGSSDYIETVRGNDIFKRISLLSGVILLFFLVGFWGISSYLQYKEQALISSLSVDRKKYKTYSKLIQREQELNKNIYLINESKDVRSTHAWYIHELEKVLPKSIYLISIEIEKQQDMTYRYVLKGSVKNEIDLYNMMTTMKNKLFIKDIKLNRTIKKNNEFSQFELELMVE